MSSNQVLMQLQEMLLRAVLLGQPLPGYDQPVRIPDLEFITRQPDIYLVDQNLAGPITLPDAPKPLRIVSAETLQQEAQIKGNIAYLQFHVTEAADSSIRLRLETRIATAEPNRGELGLSSIDVTFSKVGNEWRVVDAPIYSAA
jgi:hypothetical protein